MLQLLTRGKKRRRRSRGGSGIPVLGVVLRWFTPGLTLTGVIAFLGALLTGNIDLSSLESLRGSTEPVYEEPLAQTLPPEMRGPDVTLPARPKSNIAPVSLQRPASNNHATITHGNRPGDAIRIGSFNIQVFGETKSSKPDVMQHIARIVSYFDVLGIQEIRGDSNAIMGRLLGALRSQGLRYQAVTSPPIGRTSQTESYGFIWDPDRVKLVPQSQYVVGDGEGQNDLLHREPMVATFEAVSRWPSRAPFRFTVINMHTDPDEVAGPGPYNELNVLDDVFRRVRDFEWHSFGEEDFILLGDLNVAVKGLAELG
ncbi:MAG: endonuclease/exonuclease/phosphatase family protein, partial [Planctomycetota bacterium]